MSNLPHRSFYYSSLVKNNNSMGIVENFSCHQPNNNNLNEIPQNLVPEFKGLSTNQYVLDQDHHPIFHHDQHPEVQGNQHPAVQGNQHPAVQGNQHPTIQGNQHPALIHRHPQVLDHNKTTEDIFLVFYTPGCPHCQKIRPDITTAMGGIATDISNYQKGLYNKIDNKGIILVNGDEHPGLAKNFGINSIPSFRLLRGVHNRNLFDSENILDYQGGRSKTDFETFLNYDKNSKLSKVKGKIGTLLQQQQIMKKQQELTKISEQDSYLVTAYNNLRSHVCNNNTLKSEIDGCPKTQNEGFANPDEDAFVMFYAPWCGHCQNAKPEVGKALGGIATEYSDYQKGQYQKKGKTAIVMVNGDDHPELTQQFGVQGYPTFKLLKGVSDKKTLNCQSTHDYSGGRSSGDFERFLGGDSHEGFANPDEDAFVMFYAPWCGHCKNAKPEVGKALGGIATEYSDYQKGKYQKKGKTAIVMVNGDDHPELTQQFGVQGYPTFKLLKGVSDKNTLSCQSTHDSGGRSSGDFERFLGGDSHEGFANPDEDAFVMFYAPWCGHCKNAKPEVGKALGGIATEYSDYQKGKYQKKGKTAIVMVNGDDHPELTQQFGVQGYPTFKLLKGVSDKNTLSCQSTHDYSGGRSSGDFERFLGGGLT